MKRILYLFFLLLLPLSASGQINTYIGGNIQGNYSVSWGEGHQFKPGVGVGFSFVYWEYEYWFFKAGIDLTHKASAKLDYPDGFTNDPIGPDDKVMIDFNEQTLGIPLGMFFRPWEEGPNAILVGCLFEAIFVSRLTEETEEYGQIGGKVGFESQANIGLHAGYQYQLDRYNYLNIYAGYEVDLRSPRQFNSITLTLEVIFGVH